MAIRRLFATAAVVGLALGLCAVPAVAGPHSDESVSFFTGGQGTASWARYSPSPAGDPDNWSIQLTVPDGTSYAGATLAKAAGPPPANAPSFDFNSSVTSASGGSPRLVMRFSDGGNAELRPLAWVAAQWLKPGPTDWDIHGGTCGPFLYEQTYATVLSCHAGASVTSVYVVTDSGWMMARGYTHWIDNISYGNRLITRPENDQS